MRRSGDIPAAIINLRIAVAETLGANRNTILQYANIGPEILSNLKARITVEQVMNVWTAIAKQTGSDNKVHAKGQIICAKGQLFPRTMIYL